MEGTVWAILVLHLVESRRTMPQKWGDVTLKSPTPDEVRLLGKLEETDELPTYPSFCPYMTRSLFLSLGFRLPFIMWA